MAVYVYTAGPAGTGEAPGQGAGPGAGRRSPARPVQGTIVADSPRQARDRLRARGLRVRALREQAAAGGTGLLDRYRARREQARVTAFFQDLATLLAADLPLVESLDTVTRQYGPGPFQRSILLLREHVASGGSLAEGMARQPGRFDELARSIVAVGENAGDLEQALTRLVGFRRRSAGLRNRVASAMLYPAIVLALGVGVSVFLMTHVVPRLLGVLAESGRALPMPTRVVKAMSDTLVHGWWILLPLAALALAGGGLGFSSARGRRAWDRWQLCVPVLGALVRKQAIARMAGVMAALLKSGVPFVEAMAITRRTLGNHVLREALAACERAVESGRDIGAALERTGAFPPVVVQIFAVGQVSGRLESLLEDLAATYEGEVEIASNRFTSLLEPILMILLAATVGLIAFATILPILEAGDVL